MPVPLHKSFPVLSSCRNPQPQTDRQSMYQRILIATRSAACSSLIQFLQERNHDVSMAIPSSHGALLSLYSPLLPSDNIHIVEEEEISQFEGQDLFLYLELAPRNVNKTPTVEVHFGKVPEAYGSDPVFWALKEGKRLAYISLLQHHPDSNDLTLLLEKSFDIMNGENIGMLSARLSLLMVTQIEEVLKGIGGGKTIAAEELTIHPYPSDQDFDILWDEMEALKIEHLADAANPKYGGARTKIAGAPIQILEVSQANVNLPEGQPPSPPGTIIHASPDQGLFVACKGNTFIRINILSTSEGFFTGQKLASLGTQPGITLG